MVKKYEFIDRILYLIRKRLEKNLPDETSLSEMIEKAKIEIKKIY